MKIAVNQKGPSTLASIIMEVEPMPEKDKRQMLDAVRKRKYFLAAFKLDRKIKKNTINMSEITAEVKKVRKLRNNNGSK